MLYKMNQSPKKQD